MANRYSRTFSSKAYILRYLILKILRSEYLENQLIPSENRLAIKFQCARLTSRSALITLVNIGVLTVNQGFGYVVSKHAMGILFYSYKLLKKSVRSEIFVLKKFNIQYFDNFDFHGGSEIFVLNNFNKRNELESIIYLLVNKITVPAFFREEYKSQENPILKIIELSIFPKTINTDFIESKINDDNQQIKELNYNLNFSIPFIFQEWVDKNGNWMIKTVNITKNGNNLFTTIVKV
ncbi:MAG: GntR family transcriptional regulator [Mycoplasmoidaceae bacterium]